MPDSSFKATDKEARVPMHNTSDVNVLQIALSVSRLPSNGQRPFGKLFGHRITLAEAVGILRLCIALALALAVIAMSLAMVVTGLAAFVRGFMVGLAITYACTGVLCMVWEPAPHS